MTYPTQTYSGNQFPDKDRQFIFRFRGQECWSDIGIITVFDDKELVMTSHSDTWLDELPPFVWCYTPRIAQVGTSACRCNPSQPKFAAYDCPEHGL